MYVVLWEFHVRAGAEAAFERLYGPDGAWVALFLTAGDYLGTELLRAADGAARYVTVDRWRSADAYDAYRSAAADRYAEIDAVGDGLTDAERFVGAYVVVDD